MNKIKTWILNNKLSSVLILILVFFLYRYFFAGRIYLGSGVNRVTSYDTMEYAMDEMMGSAPAPSRALTSSKMVPSIDGGSPQLNITDRMVVTNSHLSLLVRDVNQEMTDIKNKTAEVGGYMVSSSVTTPEEMTNGTLTIRVPSDKLEGMLSYLRGIAVKVVSENINGTDVTDQYVDIEERLQTYEATKTKYEEILNSATDVEDILTVTERIIYVQNQIDSLKGQMQYLEKTSSSSLITIYLSTDELELPYAPTNSWRPNVIFKYAVRSLITNVRKVGTAGIWLVVYLPVIALVWLAFKAFKLWKNKRETNTDQS